MPLRKVVFYAEIETLDPPGTVGGIVEELIKQQFHVTDTSYQDYSDWWRDRIDEFERARLGPAYERGYADGLRAATAPGSLLD